MRQESLLALQICYFNTALYISVLIFSERSVRAYRKEFFDNKFRFLECQQGKQERLLVLNDENLRKTAAEWVRVNTFKRGEPNMTALNFCEYVNSTLLPSQHLPPELATSIFQSKQGSYLNTVQQEMGTGQELSS